MASVKSPLQIQREEHDETLLAKKVSIVSAVTTYVIADIAAGEQIAILGNVTVEQGDDPWVSAIPSGATVYQGTTPWTSSLRGNVTLDDGSLTGIVGNVTLSDSKGFIGLTSVSGFANTLPVSFSGNVTLDDGSLTGITGNVTLSDAKTYVGLTTSTLGLGTATIGKVGALQETSPWVISATDLDIRDLSATQDNVAIKGNMTLSDSKAFIGLVSVSGFANPLPVSFSGNVTLDDGSLTGIVGNMTLSDAKTFIGLTTTTLGASPAFIGLVSVAQPISTTFSGNVTLDDGSLTGIVGNVTLSDAKTYIGLVTATPVGLVTTIQAGNATIIHGSNVTLNASPAFIGIVSIIYAPPPIATYTSFCTIFSTTGNLSLFAPPAGKRFVLKDLH